MSDISLHPSITENNSSFGNHSWWYSRAEKKWYTVWKRKKRKRKI